MDTWKPQRKPICTQRKYAEKLHNCNLSSGLNPGDTKQQGCAIMYTPNINILYKFTYFMLARFEVLAPPVSCDKSRCFHKPYCFSLCFSIHFCLFVPYYWLLFSSYSCFLVLFFFLAYAWLFECPRL